MKCQQCNKEVDLPFRCSYCNSYFCVDHKLPESHQCPNLPKQPKFWYQEKRIAEIEPLKSAKEVTQKRPIVEPIKTEWRPKPRISKSEIKELLSVYLVSAALSLIGLGIVYWQVHSPALVFLLVFYVIPIPLILIGIVLFFIGFLAVIGTSVSAIKKPSISTKLLAIPLVFSLITLSLFGFTVLSTMHKTFYVGTNFVEVNYIRGRIFNLINEERLSRNLPVLSFDQKLSDVAQLWSEDLAKRGVLEHGNFEVRMLQIGYGSYQCGEIIEQIDLQGIGFFQSPLDQEFVDGWLKSSGHRNILLMPSTGYLGVGVAKSSGSVYAVADFRFG